MAFATPKRTAQTKTNEIINKFNSATKQSHNLVTTTISSQKRANPYTDFTPLAEKKQATNRENVIKSATPATNKYSASSGIASQSIGANQNDNLITVAVRIRPLEAKETTAGPTNAVRFNPQSNQIVVINDLKQQQAPLTFTCDHIITDQKSASSASSTGTDGDAQQQFVYECLGRPLLDKAFAGYNVSIFAYGQTGSGKTYSMIGTQEQPGLIPRFFDELFNRRNDTVESNNSGGEYTNHIEISYYEIYNEKIYDLLRSNSTDSKGKVFFIFKLT
jgi:hypothetical protein